MDIESLRQDAQIIRQQYLKKLFLKVMQQLLSYTWIMELFLV
jgi:hypothetical protein